MSSGDFFRDHVTHVEVVVPPPLAPPCQTCGYRHAPTVTDTVDIVQVADTYHCRPGRLRPFTPNYEVRVDGHVFVQSTRADARHIARKYADGRPVTENFR